MLLLTRMPDANDWPSIGPTGEAVAGRRLGTEHPAQHEPERTGPPGGNRVGLPVTADHRRGDSAGIELVD